MFTSAIHANRRALIVPLLAFVAHDVAASDLDGKWAATLYAARVSSESGWEDVFVNPLGADYVSAFLAVAGLSRGYAHYYGGALQLEAEGQIAYAFGDQRYWEFNVVPVVARCKQSLIYWVAELTAGLPDKPWSVSLRLHHRSVAYGLMGDEGGMNAVGQGIRWQF